MNNQSTEAIDYEGTKYTITVVNGNSAEAVIGMIKAVPEITYANYKTQASKVSAARAAYDALTQKAKAEISQTLLNKLEAAEEKIEFYEKIDAAKKLLKELPAVNKNKVPTSSLIRQVRKAADAYEKLNSKQREYITAEDAGRYEALRLWLIESGAVGQNELPVIDGSLTLPEQDGVEVVLEPKASVDNSGNASAAVTAADLNKLLDEALEAEASVLVIVPTGAEQASAISVELPRCTLDNALDETNADLAVRTPAGRAVHAKSHPCQNPEWGRRAGSDRQYGTAHHLPGRGSAERQGGRYGRADERCLCGGGVPYLRQQVHHQLWRPVHYPASARECRCIPGGPGLHRIPDQRRRRGREVGWRLPEPERRALGKGQHDPIGHLCCSTAGTAGAAPLHRRA